MKRRDRHETLASGRLGCRLRPWYFLAETVSGCPLPAMRADLQVVASAVLAGCWQSCDLGGRWATRRAAATLRACYCPESLLDYRCHPEARRRRADEGPPRTQPATGPVRFRGILRSLRFHEKARECQGHRGGLTSCCWLGSTVAPTATGSDRQASIRTRCEPPWARCTLGSIQFGCCNLAIGVPSGCVKRPDGTSAATAVTRTGRWTRVAGRRIGFTVRSQEHFPRWRRLFLSGSEARADSSFGVVERVVGRLALPQTVQEDGQLACNGDHGSFLVFL